VPGKILIAQQFSLYVFLREINMQVAGLLQVIQGHFQTQECLGVPDPYPEMPPHLPPPCLLFATSPRAAVAGVHAEEA